MTERLVYSRRPPRDDPDNRAVLTIWCPNPSCPEVGVERGTINAAEAGRVECPSCGAVIEFTVSVRW